MRPLLLFVFLLVACATTKAQAVVLTEQDKDKTLKLSVGERFVIRLNENPTTGYMWAVDGQTELLLLQGSDYVTDAPSTPHGVVLGGVGGKRSFTFSAQKSGTVTLKLRHWRSWEGNSSIVDTFSVPVQIEAK